jgi:uncharacterized Zn finger protein
MKPRVAPQVRATLGYYTKRRWRRGNCTSIGLSFCPHFSVNPPQISTIGHRKLIKQWSNSRDVEVDIPVRVENGLQPRSQRGEIAQNWWARQFLKGIEDGVVRSELETGRRYARKGEVAWMEISAGEVKGSVRGVVAEPYTVEITCDVLAPAVWDEILTTMAARLDLCAAVLGGAVPKEIEQLLKISASLSLLPASPIAGVCSCDRVEQPCRHIIALGCLATDRFDDAPLLLFELRGQPQDGFLARLRELWGLQPPVPGQVEAPRPLSRTVSGYYDRPAAVETVDVPRVIELNALDELGSPPFFNVGDSASIQSLRTIYNDHSAER